MYYSTCCYLFKYSIVLYIVTYLWYPLYVLILYNMVTVTLFIYSITHSAVLGLIWFNLKVIHMVYIVYIFPSLYQPLEWYRGHLLSSRGVLCDFMSLYFVRLRVTLTCCHYCVYKYTGLFVEFNRGRVWCPRYTILAPIGRCMPF